MSGREIRKSLYVLPSIKTYQNIKLKLSTEPPVSIYTNRQYINRKIGFGYCKKEKNQVTRGGFEPPRATPGNVK